MIAPQHQMIVSVGDRNSVRRPKADAIRGAFEALNMLLGSAAEPLDQDAVTQATVAYYQRILAQLFHHCPDDARAG